MVLNFYLCFINIGLKCLNVYYKKADKNAKAEENNKPVVSDIFWEKEKQ